MSDKTASPADELDGKAASSTAEDVNIESPSSGDAADVVAKETVDIVADVLKSRERQDSSPEDSQDANDEDSETPEAGAEGDGSEGDQGEDAGNTESNADSDPALDEPVTAEENLPFGKHPRFKALLAERDEWRDKASSYEGPAQQFREVESFLQENNLSAADTTEALVLAAQIKEVQSGTGDPRAVLAALDKYRGPLLALTGEVLPEDLRDRVDSGELTTEDAQRIARSEAAQRRADAALQAQRTRQAADQKSREQKDANDALAELQANSEKLILEWEGSVRVNDPDFDKKAPLIEGEMLRLATKNGRPKTPEGVRDMARQAYANVNKVFARKAPKPDTPSTPSSERPSSNSGATPKTTLDVIDMTLGSGRAA